MAEAFNLEYFEPITELEENSTKTERFKIIDTQTANWALRKIRQLNIKKSENAITADKERNRINEELRIINDWENKKNESINNSILYLESLLKEYLYELRKQDPKAKIDTPFGIVSSKKQPPKYEYTDETVIQWAKVNTLLELIRTKEELNKQAVKKLKRLKEFEGYLVDSETGEVVPGIKITYPKDEIIIKVVDCE